MAVQSSGLFILCVFLVYFTGDGPYVKMLNGTIQIKQFLRHVLYLSVCQDSESQLSAKALRILLYVAKYHDHSFALV